MVFHVCRSRYYVFPLSEVYFMPQLSKCGIIGKHIDDVLRMTMCWRPLRYRGQKFLMHSAFLKIFYREQEFSPRSSEITTLMLHKQYLYNCHRNLNFSLVLCYLWMQKRNRLPIPNGTWQIVRMTDWECS